MKTPLLLQPSIASKNYMKQRQRLRVHICLSVKQGPAFVNLNEGNSSRSLVQHAVISEPCGEELSSFQDHHNLCSEPMRLFNQCSLCSWGCCHGRNGNFGIDWFNPTFNDSIHHSLLKCESHIA